MDDDPQEFSDAVFEGRLQRGINLVRAAVTKIVQNTSNLIYNKDLRRITILEKAIKNEKKAIISYTFTFGKKTIKEEIWNMEVVEYFLKQKRVNGNSLDCSPLWLPVAKGDLKTVKVLLESGANVDTKDSNWEVLHAAVFCRGTQYREIIEILLQNGFTVNPESGANPPFLYDAVEKGYLNIVEPLLKYGVDVNMKFGCDRMSLLHVAVKCKQVEMAKLLISYAADVNAKDKLDKTPIFYAIENTILNMIKLLLNNSPIAKATSNPLNIDINATDIDGRTPLHFIAVDYPVDVKNISLIGPSEYNVYKDIVKLLLSRGADINAVNNSGLTLFELAIRHNYAKIVEALLEHVDVNSTFKDEMTPLHCSARNGHVIISKMLLSKGANVNAKQNEKNWTPLHFALYMGYKEVIEVLIRCGAKVDSSIISDIALYHPSIFSTSLSNNYPEIFELLLENGADINFRNKRNGETVLFNIVRCEEAKDVIALLKFGADVNIENRDRHSLLYFAAEKTVGILYSHIAKLKAAKLYLSRNNLLSLRYLSRNKYITSDFQNECNEEVSRMKSEIIATTNVSFYDILSKHVSILALYARNKIILQAVESNDYKVKFPIYASMITCNIKRGKLLNKFSEGVYEFFDAIPNDFPELPYYCKTEILSYLSNEDLRNLKLSVRKEDERKVLLDQGYRYFHLIDILGFSYKFTEKICSYLSNDDLRNLVEACKSAKVNIGTFSPLSSPNRQLLNRRRLF